MTPETGTPDKSLLHEKDLDFLRQNMEEICLKYANQWIALNDGGIAGNHQRLGELDKLLRQNDIRNSLFIMIPSVEDQEKLKSGAWVI